jgi:hypothetical protein
VRLLQAAAVMAVHPSRDCCCRQEVALRLCEMPPLRPAAVESPVLRLRMQACYQPEVLPVQAALAAAAGPATATKHTT